MSELQELYRELVIDHGRNPRYFGALSTANRTAEGFNPLCGDKLTVYLQVNSKTETIESIQFEGAGCAISIASASMMAERLRGKTLPETQEIYQLFHQQVTTDTPHNTSTIDKLGKLGALSGVRAFPSRVKCATLAWHTLQKALKQPDTAIITEKS